MEGCLAMEEPDVEVGEQGIQELSQLGLVVVCTLGNPHLHNRHIKESVFRGRMPLCRWFRFAQLAKGKKFRP